VSLHGVGQVGLTLALFVVVYLVVFGAGTVFLLRLIGAGPHEGEGDEPVPGGPGQHRQQMRPMSAAPAAEATSPLPAPRPARSGLAPGDLNVVARRS